MLNFVVVNFQKHTKKNKKTAKLPTIIYIKSPIYPMRNNFNKILSLRGKNDLFKNSVKDIFYA